MQEHLKKIKTNIPPPP
jgi:hypothetical protein